MRSRCDRPAQVRLTYDTLTCQVWLDPLPSSSGLVQEICEFHAKRLTLPMGWRLSDRRSATPTLFDLESMPVRPPLPSAHAEAVVASVPESRTSERGYGNRPAPRLVRGRHPSLNASEFFGLEDSMAGAATADYGSGGTHGNGGSGTGLFASVLEAVDDGYMSFVSYEERSIERVVLLDPLESDQRRGA